MIRNVYSNQQIKVLSFYKNYQRYQSDREYCVNKIVSFTVIKRPIILSNSRRRYHNNNNNNNQHHRFSRVKKWINDGGGWPLIPWSWSPLTRTSCLAFTTTATTASASGNYNRCIAATDARHSYVNNNNKDNNKVIKSITRNLNQRQAPGKTEKKMGVFKFTDYDCVGFDLDNTLLRYNITNMVTLEYRVLAKFLVENRQYDSKHLYKPLESSDYDFMQKGLVLDFDLGNVLRLSSDGFILRASHGTKILSDDKLDAVYPERRWHVTDAFSKDLLVTWNGPLSEKMRTLLDYFDMPASLVFARVIDTLDESNGGDAPINGYNVWPDVLDGLIDMFDRSGFKGEQKTYFPALKREPSKYMHKSSQELVSWLKDLKTHRLTYLITGSNVDFADFTAKYALGEDWRSLFDIVICYAKKPGFFNGSRPFLSLEDYSESTAVPGDELKRGEIYSQGNWKELKEFFARETGKESPACLYVGDNLIQDIYTPKHYADCDTVAIVEEQLSEGMTNHILSHSDEKVLNSGIWGSYFRIQCRNDQLKPSIWSHIIDNYSKICVPSVELLVNNSLDTPLKSFGKEDDRKLCGYHPGKPKSVAAIL